MMKSWTSLKISHVGSKTRSLGQILEKPCVRCRGHIFSPIIMKLGQNLCLDKIWHEFEKSHVGSKTRSLGQMLEKPCVHCRGYIFSLIIMKHCHNVCLIEISDEVENGSCWVRI